MDLPLRISRFMDHPKIYKFIGPLIKVAFSCPVCLPYADLGKEYNQPTLTLMPMQTSRSMKAHTAQLIR